MRRWRIFPGLMSVAAVLLCGGTSLPAAIITNADISDISVTLPSNWELNTTHDAYTIGNYAALFDGVTENSTSVGRVLWKRLPGGTALSSTNFISIKVKLNGPFDVQALGFVHDWGSQPQQEIGAAEVYLANNDGPLGSFSKTGLNGGVAVTNDVQYVFTGASVRPVTEFEVRITGSDAQSANTFVELREIVVEANAVPEPASYLVFGGLAFCFGLAGVYRRRRCLR